MPRADQRNKEVILGPYHEFYIDDPIDSAREGYWRDMTADLAGARAAGANIPSWANFRDGLYAWQFASNQTNELWVVFHPNHDGIEGELCYPHIHFSPTTTSTGVVKWGIEYTMAKGFDQEAFPASTTIDLSYEITANKQYQHLITEASDGTAFALPEVDSLIMVRMFRDATDAADTFPDAIMALTMDIHYRAFKLGTKGKRPDFDEAD